ncbi:MAG: hypothetical protein WCI61_10580 [Chloroflexota bacterium]
MGAQTPTGSVCDSLLYLSEPIHPPAGVTKVAPGLSHRGDTISVSVAGFPANAEVGVTLSIPQTDNVIGPFGAGRTDGRGEAILTFAMPDASQLMRNPALPCLAVVVSTSTRSSGSVQVSAGGILAYAP